MEREFTNARPAVPARAPGKRPVREVPSPLPQIEKQPVSPQTPSSPKPVVVPKRELVPA